MQMVKRIIGGFFLLIPLLWLFAPKQELYYLIEKELVKKGVIISNEKFTDNWFGLTITDADIYLKGIKVAEAEVLKINLFFFYNQLRIENVTTDKGIHNVAPKSIDSLNATLSVLSPLKVLLAGDGSFGSIDGDVNFNEKRVLIRFINTKEINAFRKFLKKDEKGVYYEVTYR